MPKSMPHHKRFEYDVAGANGKRRPGSGNGWEKLDAQSYDFLWDCKATVATQKQDGKSLRITKRMWDEICFHAEREGLLPGWMGRMEECEDLATVRRSDLEGILEELEEIRKENRKLKEEIGQIRSKKSKAK